MPCVSMRPHMAWYGTVNAWHNAAVPCPHPVQKVDRACCKVGLDNVRDSRNVDAARGCVCGYQHNAVPAEEQEAHWLSPAARALSDLYDPVRHTKHRQQRSRQRAHRHWRKATEHPRQVTRTRVPPTHTLAPRPGSQSASRMRRAAPVAHGVQGCCALLGGDAAVVQQWLQASLGQRGSG